ncbi:hypothetical protein GobsT_18050 [Gemmata obscuriglobus]|uniref:Chromosome segregation protein SMC n=1 Tax=Gemmata obscuriglobus TaxID=114 RepID=A0A2Z3H9Y7_9BACT|nr:hypothetical protein [Gemmata obscuriglobus]AWM39825.1 hypothetical protein C1280_24340 [Gemmata obscuriglobus]QEG27052.1 hypothetical protein GobsT_18050 [Gemmata obscuriglobus]VTS03449.1 Uncharacterized protein OS=Pirellula staleyi (strain ATCC 27377 / DSM 6068 / ICPB 4128) GN=Psta_3425 PE=4 SV=1 [Gemmata obscuriglobus UQM 2246]
MTRKSAKPGKRTSPLIWVKQVTLYRSLSPVDEIRTIPFAPGLNIIQGKSDDSAQDFESGHGNGKTTLCRLIRYCLGEKTFGQQHVVEEVRHCFPKGYVGAVVVVDGDEWAVLRKLGTGGRDRVKRGVTLAKLAAAAADQPYTEFLKHVQELVLSGLKHREVLSGGQAVQWSHLLALCSRDQESRYDRFWNVRPARSDSGVTKFTKVDVSLCVRAMLGLLDIREPQILKRQAELDAELGELRDKIKLKAAEPAFHIEQTRKRLRDECEVPGADAAPLDNRVLGNIRQMTEGRISDLEQERAAVEKRIEDLDTQINGATARLNEIHELQEQSDSAKVVTATGTAVLEESVSPESQRQTILEKGFKSCPTGELVSECEMVKKKLADLEGEIAKKPPEGQRRVLRVVQNRDQVETALGTEAKRQEDSLERIRTKLKQLNEAKNDLSDRRRDINNLLKVVPLVTNDLLKWHRVESGEEPNHELAALSSDEQNKQAEVERLKQELSELLVKQNERMEQFRQRFHSIVQQAITGTFKGTVAVDKEEIAFRISRERSLAGEAYETLAVLLADLAILVESSSGSVCHPGLLIHDSPREADLNVRLYERMLDTAFSLMSDAGTTPYQYIVTTTTQPSEALRSADVTKEVLSGGAGSLFRRQLEIAQSDSEQQSLFNDEEGA